MSKGAKPSSATISSMAENAINSTISSLLNLTGHLIDGGPINDEDEYAALRAAKWKRISDIYKAMHKANFAIAMILACCSILMLTTLRQQKLREHSVMWYLYHLMSLNIAVAILHTVALYGKLHQNEGVCLFVIYSLEYLFLAFSTIIILANTEIFFTIVLPLEWWRTKHFLRFIVSVLASWIVICLIVGHLIIDNNDARRDGSYCYYSRSKSIREARFALRTALPAAIGLLFTLSSIIVYFVKRHRSLKSNTSETFKEIVFSNERDEMCWIRMAAGMNFLFVLRGSIFLIMKIPSVYTDYEKNIYAIVVLIALHVQSLNLIPVPMLLLPEVREGIVRMFNAVLRCITRGRIGSDDDKETLAVSYGNMNMTD